MNPHERHAQAQEKAANVLVLLNGTEFVLSTARERLADVLLVGEREQALIAEAEELLAVLAASINDAQVQIVSALDDMSNLDAVGGGGPAAEARVLLSPPCPLTSRQPRHTNLAAQANHKDPR